MNFSALYEPFPEKDIEWRVQQAGNRNNQPWARVLAYVTNRAIMDRLDAVVGQENWANEFKEWRGGSICGISIRVDPKAHVWVTKWDGSDPSNMEQFKGMLSGSMKRAAVQWGIGRYLYNLEAGWAQFRPGGLYKSKIDGAWFDWDPPRLPEWALPNNQQAA